MLILRASVLIDLVTGMDRYSTLAEHWRCLLNPP